jgi:hypothetical protein
VVRKKLGLTLISEKAERVYRVPAAPSPATSVMLSCSQLTSQIDPMGDIISASIAEIAQLE